MTKQETAAEMQQASLIKLAESTKFKKVGQLVDPLTFIPSTSVEGIFNPEDLQDAFAYFGVYKLYIVHH